MLSAARLCLAIIERALEADDACDRAFRTCSNFAEAQAAVVDAADYFRAAVRALRAAQELGR